VGGEREKQQDGIPKRGEREEKVRDTERDRQRQREKEGLEEGERERGRWEGRRKMEECETEGERDIGE